MSRYNPKCLCDACVLLKMRNEGNKAKDATEVLVEKVKRFPQDHKNG